MEKRQQGWFLIHLSNSSSWIPEKLCKHWRLLILRDLVLEMVRPSCPTQLFDVFFSRKQILKPKGWPGLTSGGRNRGIFLQFSWSMNVGRKKKIQSWWMRMEKSWATDCEVFYSCTMGRSHPLQQVSELCHDSSLSSSWAESTARDEIQRQNCRSAWSSNALHGDSPAPEIKMQLL